MLAISHILGCLVKSKQVAWLHQHISHDFVLNTKFEPVVYHQKMVKKVSSHKIHCILHKSVYLCGCWYDYSTFQCTEQTMTLPDSSDTDASSAVIENLTCRERNQGL